MSPVDTGFRVWQDFRRDEAVTRSQERMRMLLREFGDELARRVNRLRIARRIVRDLERLDLTNESLVRVLREHYESLYPGLLRLAVFRREEATEEAKHSVPVHFRQVAADGRRYRYLREQVARDNARRQENSLFEIENGIGINTGDVIQGTIGSRDHRVDLTVVGDGVNIAAVWKNFPGKGSIHGL